MAEPTGVSDQKGDTGSAAKHGRAAVCWRSAWPVPALVVGVGLLAAGVVTGMKGSKEAHAAELLAAANKAIEAGRCEEGLDLLNRRVLPIAETEGGLTGAERGEFHRLRASALFLAQRKEGTDDEANHALIVGEYLLAEEAGAVLSPEDAVRVAESYLSLNEIGKAAERAAALPETEAGARCGVLKRAIERGLGAGRAETGEIVGLLDRLLSDPNLPAPDRAWAVARSAELDLDGEGRGEGGGTLVTRLLRELHRLEGDAAAPARGELHLLLGRAYVRIGDRVNAAKQLRLAAETLAENDPLRGEAMVALGLIHQGSGELDEAREEFAVVVAEHARSRAFLPALLGLGEVEAGLKNDEGALETLARLVEEMGKPGGAGRAVAVTPERVASGLVNLSAERLGMGDAGTALRYVLLAEHVFPVSGAPAGVVLALAMAHRAAGEELVGEGAVTGEARGHLRDAARLFEAHAARVRVGDAGLSADSLWNAGEAYDRAGDFAGAGRVFGDYAREGSADDPRRPAARFRLAQSLRALGDFGAAAGLYRELIGAKGEGQNAGDGGGAAGLWADASVAPLARSLLLDADPSNDGEAERLLVSVVDGGTLAPEAEGFKAALFELGDLLYGAGRYAEAISRLEEAVSRYPEDPAAGGVGLRFKLAECLRLSAEEIRRSFDDAMPRDRLEELETERADRLRRAAELYAGACAELEAKGEESRSELERVRLRNARFYLGDCAYDLGEFDTAVLHYDAARQKHADDPASLVAMVQIVNAYVEQGEWEKARTAHERARQHYARLPESAWASPDVPMERKHWERWLESGMLLEGRAQAGE